MSKKYHEKNREVFLVDKSYEEFEEWKYDFSYTDPEWSIQKAEKLKNNNSTKNNSTKNKIANKVNNVVCFNCEKKVKIRQNENNSKVKCRCGVVITFDE